MRFIRMIFSFVWNRKKLFFIYLPVGISVAIVSYVLIIYLGWLGNRDAALERLARYKKLIDRTEEMRKGYAYSYSDVDLNAKVVDIPTRIYDRNNEIIGEFFEQKREIVPYDFIPQAIVKGVVASEDRDFYKHDGLNYKGIFRAFVTNLVHLRVVQGGSTITQQLGKVLFTDMERSLRRKIFEAFCAIEIEKHYDKQDIFSMYLNLIYFGNGAYGVESASKMYFGKPVNELNEVECAVIVATISSPRIYSPISNLKNSIRKTRRILKSMVDAGFTKKARADYQYKKFLNKWDVKFDKEGVAVSSLIGTFMHSSYRINRAPFFNEQVRRLLVGRFGESVVKKGGLSVYTTIDGPRQDIALTALRKGIEKQRNFHLKRSKKIRNHIRAKKEEEKIKNIEGALIALDPYSGEIISYVGGSKFSASNQNDHVSQIRRQPGSSFKPLIYASAIADKDITPATVMVDEKVTFKGGYKPRNYTRKYVGNIIIREALRKSVNVVAVKVLDKTGYGTILEAVEKALDLSGSERRKRFGKTLSLALGTYEISPLENAVLHSLLINGGKFIKPYGIRQVKDYSGNVVWNPEEGILKEIRDKQARYGTILDPKAAAVTIAMLRGVFEKGGTAYYAAKYHKIPFQIAGKTGTSTNYNDAWFVGYTSKLVSAVWIGNKQGAISLGPGRAGGSVSAPVWTEFIAKAYRDESVPDFTIPDKGISREDICIESGLVAIEGKCKKVIKNQLFLEGSEPGDYCNIHDKEEPEEKKESEKE